ncbi:MAG: hypothetical protein KDB63_05860 [Nocardioidaceae bacterium]|nr:hypothetical protein [Nocardioidaceae bacterium]
MYGDTTVMRRRVTALREQALDLRSLADRLVGQVEAIGWTGRAADAMRARIRERASQLRAVAASHDTAADALEVHLGEVDLVKDAIGDRERRAEALLGEAPAGFEAPPAGHRDWLTVDLPES